MITYPQFVHMKLEGWFANCFCRRKRQLGG